MLGKTQILAEEKILINRFQIDHRRLTYKSLMTKKEHLFSKTCEVLILKV